MKKQKRTDSDFDFENDFDMGFEESLVVKPQERPRVPEWLILAAGAVLLLVIGFFTIHVWETDSCTTPAVCKICGRVSRKTSGHQWQEATCTTPWICLKCGQIGGSALDHSWVLDAGNQSMTCSVCGQTKDIAYSETVPNTGPVSVLTDVERFPDGRIRFGHEVIGGEWVTWEYVYDHNNAFLYRKRMIEQIDLDWSGKYIPGSHMSYQVTEYPVENCIGFTFVFNITNVPRGTGRGERRLMVLDDAGNWETLLNFDYPEYEPVELEVILDEPMTLTAIGTLKVKTSSNNIYDATGELLNVWVVNYTY